MSFQARRELLAQVASRYREAEHAQKTSLLDEFVASTGYARKYAIRLLSRPPRPVPRPIARPRARRYGPVVQQALVVVWAAANCVCGKRLVPFLPELIAALERHGQLTLSEETRAELLTLSPATADRLLRPLRQAEGQQGRSTTKPGSLLKHQVPVRTFADWSEHQPGFMEADLVAHCGGDVSGAFLYTLVLTDVATGWTECRPLLHKSQEAVLQALVHARELLPFPLLGLDTDNGSEFLNQQLVEYCRVHEITFTRGRAYKKNDQCFVEQKNGVVVRQWVGYDRLEGQRAYQQLAEVYRAVRLYVNFFQPSMKLVSKRREGAKVSRRYDPAQTPWQRLLTADCLSQAARTQLSGFYQALDPVRLLEHLERLQDALWQHARFDTLHAEAEIPAVAIPEPRVFQHARVRGSGRQTPVNAEAESFSVEHPATDGLSKKAKRKYRRSGKPRVPHTWRTRPDPFADVWEEVQAWLGAEPERTAKSLFEQLQAQYPGDFAAGQLRTLQRRVKEWRREAILTFDAGWLEEERLAGSVLPGPLRAIIAAPSVEPLAVVETVEAQEPEAAFV
jgi:hypothetical protein